jgi:transcriptional regulator with XRE-family HTH domain
MGCKPKLNPAQRRKAAQLRARGWTLAAVGRRFRVSTATVHRVLNGEASACRAMPCSTCGAAVAAAVRRGDEGATLCRPCATRLPGVTLGQRLKAFRLDAGLTRGALARRAVVSAAKFSEYEHDRVKPNLLTRAKLARALGVGLKALEGNDHAAR